MKNVMKKKAEIFENDPVDQAGLDLGFIEAFINLLARMKIIRGLKRWVILSKNQ